jgi:hypothetical protein
VDKVIQNETHNKESPEMDYVCWESKADQDTAEHHFCIVYHPVSEWLSNYHRMYEWIKLTNNNIREVIA